MMETGKGIPIASKLRLVSVACVFALLCPTVFAAQSDCDGTPSLGIPGTLIALKLEGGGIAAFSKMNINIDGYARAYHPDNAKAGALIHLCNAGRVFLPDGTRYEGSESNTTCTGRFMTDVKRIGQAGWMDASVGAVQWYGILGEGSATIAGNKIDAVKPVVQKDGSGFYVSPTALADAAIADPAAQARYVNPLHIASAVMPRALARKGVVMGSFGVAYHTGKRIAVPFVVGDQGPRIGEGSVALARQVSGLDLTDDITRANRFEGQVDTRDVLWVFFGDTPGTFDSKNESSLMESARAAFERWGGERRLLQCLDKTPRK
jgi:hypothetical protein